MKNSRLKKLPPELVVSQRFRRCLLSPRCWNKSWSGRAKHVPSFHWLLNHLKSGVTEVLVTELVDQITWAGHCCIV